MSVSVTWAINDDFDARRPPLRLTPLAWRPPLCRKQCDGTGGFERNYIFEYEKNKTKTLS